MPAARPARKKSAPLKKGAQPDLAPVFAALRQILERLGGELAVQTDRPGNYHTAIPSILHRGKPLYFAGVRTGRNYVSFYLMSVYGAAERLEGISPALRRRMQGKACFNFTAIDQECFAELGQLAAGGLKKFRSPEFRRMIERIQ
jgi:hypothetical protein